MVEDASSLANCSAVITGVSRRAGIGAAVTRRLQSAGAKLFTTGWRDYDDELPSGRDEDQPVDLPLDLSDPGSTIELFDRAADAIGPVSALILVHTVDVGGGLFDQTPALIDRHLSVNVRATLLLMKEFAMRFTGQHGTGRIVLFSTKPPQLGAISYAASKGALEWITLSAATELGPRGITVNAVNPGPNQTGWMSDNIEREAAARTPLGRVGRPEDAAALVSFLLSNDAGWITGQVISYDGGHFIAGSPFPGPTPN